ncbi:MAG TPA: HAMP domain-containing sensor histidine kinase [Caulobacteraceae bacterium]
MAQSIESSSSPVPDREHGGLSEAAAWNAAWFATTTFAALAWPPTARGSAPTWALAAASLGAAASLILRARSWPGRNHVLLLIWTIGITGAVLLYGGLTGPLAALVPAPLAAAIVLGRRRTVAAGAAFTVVVVGVAGLAAAAGGASVEPRPWLAIFAVLLIVAAVASALVLQSRRAAASEAAAAAAERRSRALLAGQGLLIVDLDLGGHVRETFGQSSEPFACGVPRGEFADLAAEPEVLKDALERARTEHRVEIMFAPAGAEDRCLAALVSAQEDGFIAVVRDVSQERSRQVLLEQSASEAFALADNKSRFLANMSHELRTPLNAVIGFSDIMRSQMFGPLAPKYTEYAELIHESGGHLLDLINDVLDLSKIEAERYEPALETFDAREAVSAALRLTRVQAETSQVRLRGALGLDPIRVNADRRAIKQIVINLVSNALKFTPAGGSVTVGLRAADGGLELVVGDTGIGISSEDLARLGNPYEQAGGPALNAMGWGLGLSLVRALCELHGGSMSIQSTLGEGTVVAVRLPVLSPEAAREADPPKSPPGDNVIAFNPGR